VKESNAAIEKAEKKQRLCAELNEFDETKRRERRSVALGKIKKKVFNLSAQKCWK